MYKNLILFLALIFSTESAFSMQQQSSFQEEIRTTCICGKAAPNACSQCKVARYCSSECQTYDWKTGHKAKCEKFMQLRQLLIQARKKPHYKKAKSTNAIFKTALDQSDEEIINALIVLGEVNPDTIRLDTAQEKPIFYAVNNRLVKSVEILAKNRLGIVNSFDAEDFTPLMRACHKGYDDIAQCLLENGASALLSANVILNRELAVATLPPVRSTTMLTPLRIAAASGSFACAKLLVEKVGSIIAHDETCAGNNALLLALNAYNTDIIRLLIQHGSKSSGPFSEEGETLLHELFCGRFVANVMEKARDAMPPIQLYKFLIEECKIDINARNRSGCTPLHLVANLGAVEAAKLLIEQFNADPHLLNAHGETPLMQARKLKKLVGALGINFESLIVYLETFKR